MGARTLRWIEGRTASFQEIVRKTSGIKSGSKTGPHDLQFVLPSLSSRRLVVRMTNSLVLAPAWVPIIYSFVAGWVSAAANVRPACVRAGVAKEGLPQ